MSYEITLETASPLTLAAVHAIVPAGGAATAWKPALDKVWAFLRTNQIPNSGLNVFLYRHSERPGEDMAVDFGVQISLPFDADGEMRCVKTPSGEVAQAVHIGPYGRFRERPRGDPSVVPGESTLKRCLMGDIWPLEQRSPEA